MITDPTAVADDAAARSLKALDEDGSEVIILGCTIIAGCLEREIMTTGRHRELPILNPNLLALKTAESLADLHRAGKYAISRAGQYQRHEQHDAAEAADVWRRWKLVDIDHPEAGRVTVDDRLGRDDRAARGRAITSGSGAGERFAIVVDTRTDGEIPRRARPAPRCDLGAEPVVVTIAPRSRSGAEPPAPAAAAMAAADVVLCAASTSLYHTAAKAAAQRAGARGDFNAPVSRRRAGANGAMTADFFAIREQAERLAALWRRRARSASPRPAGTDLRATVAGREPMAWLTGICRNPGEVSALPGGEVSLPPIEGTAEGIVVWERVASDLGALDEPVRIEVRDGRAVGDRGRRRRRPAARPSSPASRDADNIGRDRHRAQPGRPDRRRDHRGQEGARHGPRRARRLGQRVRRAGRVRRPPRRPGDDADRSSSTAGRSSSTAGTCTAEP